MARALAERGDIAADMHWRRGFAGNAVVRKPYRGFGAGVPVVVLVSALGGNVPMKGWLDDRRHDVTAIYAEYFDDEQDLPPHALMVNAIGDADLCGDALTRAARIVALARAPVINPPALVARTGRAENAARLAGVPGVVAPAIRATSKGELLAARWVRFPLLVRVPGRHTGRHFVMARDRAELEAGVAELPGDALLAIDYLDARGADGLARKYRVMFVDGRMYPLHLALSRDWKVHYFSADMAACATHRAEEAAFLADMAGVLGPVAMAALHGIGTALGLEYAGVDFALAPDGRVMLFEANATMVVNPPDKGPMWDYRRPAVAAVLDAVTWMLQRRVA
jgi:hypothetical protein